MDDQSEPPIGDDGKLSEPDLEVDPSKYKAYVASFLESVRIPINEWDESQIVAYGCSGRVYSVS